MKLDEVRQLLRVDLQGFSLDKWLERDKQLRQDHLEGKHTEFDGDCPLCHNSLVCDLRFAAGLKVTSD